MTRARFAWMLCDDPIPSERDCIVEAERRGMSVPVWDDAGDEDGFGWRVVFERKDGLALLLVRPLFLDQSEAYVCATVEVATAADGRVFSAGYGTLPYQRAWDWLGALLDCFQAWDGDGALAELVARPAPLPATR